MLLDISRYNFSAYKKEFAALVALALPMLLSQVAQVGTGFVDTVMAGSISTSDLSAVGLGNSVFFTVYITLLGVMTALNPMISQAFGIHKHKNTNDTQKAIGNLGWQGIWYGLFLGVIGLFLVWSVIGFFDKFLNLEAKTLAVSQLYLWFIGFAMPAALIHRALHAYASSLGKPKAIMIVSWICFFANIFLNWVFVYGKFGIPMLGGAGCGLATAIVFWINALLLGLYIAKDKFFAPFGLFDKFRKPDIKLFGEITRLGVPIGLSFFIEVSLFACIIFLVAKLDGDTTKLISAQQIVINLTSLIFMIPQSIGIASTVRIGINLGQNNPQQARYVSGVAISSAMAISFLTASFLIIFRYKLADMYTDDLAVIDICGTLLLFAAAFQLVDAIQCVASYALRGYKITKSPMIIHMICFWGFGIIPGVIFAFWFGLGIYGFWLALVVSLAVAAISLLWLLEKHSKKLLIG